MPDTTYILYGMSASLYTGKARSYLLHNQIPFIERGAGHPSFTQDIVPKIGRWIIPVLVTPDGSIIQDGADILDHLDGLGLSQDPLRPSDPILESLSYLFDLFGGEGLLRPAMHYRWNFDEDNLAFLKSQFSEAFPPGLNPDQQEAMFDHSSGRMRRAGAAFGVSDETAPQIVASYATFLERLEAHLSTSYFLLGGHATLGDYGLMNGLFAHLARDPHPAKLMKRLAPNVFAWTERMNRAPREEHRLKDAPSALFGDLPETLKDLMRFIAKDFLPEMVAHIRFINDWLKDHEDLPGAVIKDRSIGMAAFDWYGQTVRSAVMPYRVWMLQRLTDHYDRCVEKDRILIRDIFAEVGLSPLLDYRCHRRVNRENNQEVWGQLAK